MQDGLNRIENHATLLPAIRELIAKAQANGIPHIIVFSGARRGQGDDEGMRNCVTGLRQLASDAESAGVMLLLELLNTFDHADYQCSSAGYAFAVARAVNSPRVKVLYDIYHAHRMGEDVLTTITTNLEQIGHLHIAGSPKRDFPGEGQAIDYCHLVRAATAAGYGGYWGHEFCCGNDAVEQYCRSAGLFASYMAQG